MLIPGALTKWYLFFCVLVMVVFFHYTSRGRSMLSVFSGRTGAHKGASQFHK